jgi:hypothetical protein
MKNLTETCQQILSEAPLKSTHWHPLYSDELLNQCKQIFLTYRSANVNTRTRTYLSFVANELNDVLKEQEELAKINSPKCNICGTYFKNRIFNAHFVNHGTTYAEYKKNNPESLISDSYKEKLAEKIRKNNPAKNHGGKLSPYSTNFIKYENLSEDEKRKAITDLQEKKAKTVNEHPEKRSNRVEYWAKAGLDENEAILKVADRQNTFSFDKCIERHGDVEGKKIWKQRQIKWQNTLNSKSTEEIGAINRSKGRMFIPRSKTLCAHKFTDPGLLYVIKINENLIKVGITTKSLVKRYSSDVYAKYEVLWELPMSIYEAFCIEQLTKHRFKAKTFEKRDLDEEIVNKFGYIEIFNVSKEVFKSSFEILLKQRTNEMFEYSGNKYNEEYWKEYEDVENMVKTGQYNDNIDIHQMVTGLMERTEGIKI